MLKIRPRSEDWDRRLARVTEKHMRLSGEWGVSDCLMTAMDAVEAVTGEDPAAKVRGTYSTEQGAAKLLRRRKAENVEQMLAKLFPQLPSAFSAHRGDLAVVERNGVLSAGYVCEYGVAVKTETGLAFVDITEIRSAYQVGAR